MTIDNKQAESHEYAVNLSDLMGADLPVRMLVQGVTRKDGNVFKCEGDEYLDGLATQLYCEEDRAAAIVEIIRKKVPKHKLRFYRRKAGSSVWKRV